MNIKVEFTQLEADVLIQLLDMAVKAQGLRVAADALLITRKVQAAAEQTKIDVQTNRFTDVDVAPAQ